jgi:DNA polymerase-3 subunit gamma/tau
LKTLEEPPPHVKFLLATTEPKKLPVTILSRCLQFNLKHLTRDQIAGQLRMIVAKESVAADAESINLIAAAADGSMRDALSLLDQAIGHGGGELKGDQVRDMLGTIDSNAVAALLEALAAENPQALLGCIDKMDEHNPDYDAVLAELLADLHDIAVYQLTGGQLQEIKPGLAALAQKVSREDVQLYYQIALTGRRDLPGAPEPRLGFEMVMIRMLAFRPDGTFAGNDQSRSDRTVSPAASPAVNPGSAAPVRDTGAAGDWQRMIGEMGLSGMVKEFAGHCVLREHSEHRIHLAIHPSQEHLLKSAQKDRLQAAIHERYGRGTRLVLTAESTGGETPAQQRDRQEQERRRAAVEAFQNDPFLKNMQDIFNASVDPKSIQPK